MQRLMLPLRITALGLVAFGTVVCALCEILLAWPVAWWVYLPVLLIAGLALLRPMPPQRQPAQLASFLAIAACLLALYFVEWTTRKPFLRDLARVRIGMTEAEVRQVMAGYMEGTGWPVIPATKARLQPHSASPAKPRRAT